MRSTTFLQVLVLSTLYAGSLQAEVVLTYTTEGLSGATVSISPTLSNSAVGNASAGLFTRDPTLNSASGTNLFSSSGFPNSATLVASTDFVTFSVGPTAGNSMTLNSIQFGDSRSGTGPTSIDVRSSLDSFTASLGSWSPADSSTLTTRTVTLSSPTFANLATSIEFRFFGLSASSTAGTWRIGNNVVVDGQFTAVPEPASLGTAFLLAVAGAGAMQRKLNRKSKLN